MMNPINTPPPKKKGGSGGLLGKIIGGVAGAIGGTFVGNPIGGATLGASVGGLAGGAIDPGKIVESPQGPTSLETAMKHDPALQIGALTNAQEALRTSDMHPDDALSMNSYFDEVKNKLANKLNMGRG